MTHIPDIKKAAAPFEELPEASGVALAKWQPTEAEQRKVDNEDWKDHDHG
jgi:hypothetical protein